MSPAAPQPHSMLSQTVLGRYRIVRQLARGGMGAVYLGRTEGAEGFARPVVIKRVLPALMGDEEVAQMFVREARILSNLHHPNIVAVLDFGQDEDGAYVMVLEYVHGYPLGAWLRYARKKRGLLPVEFALHIVLRVLDALHYAHTFKRADGTVLQIIHRDVSPGNVLLDLQGQVKLLDFGIARVSGDDTEFKTERPRLKGKLPYLPLEMFKGSDPSVQSDLYSCGVVLYELLTGMNPFAAPEAAQIYYKILNEEPQSVHAVRDDAPEDIDTIVMQALAKDPAERFPSAQAMAQALRGLRDAPDEDVAARLTEQLQADFTGDMPAVMRLEPLDQREQAWRSPEALSADVDDMDVAMGDDDDEGGTDISPLDVNEQTVRASIEPELLEKARKTLITHRPAGGGRARALWLPLAAVALLSGGAFALLGRGMGEPQAETAQMKSADALPAAPPAPVAKPEADTEGEAEAATDTEGEADTEAAADTEGEAEAAADTEGEADTEAAATAEPEAKPPPPNPRRLTRIFGRKAAKVEACFGRHAKELEGRPQLSIRFVVNTAGRVEQADIAPASLAATDLGKCLAHVAKATYFGPQQREVAFRIPITARRVE